MNIRLLKLISWFNSRNHFQQNFLLFSFNWDSSGTSNHARMLLKTEHSWCAVDEYVLNVYCEKGEIEEVSELGGGCRPQFPSVSTVRFFRNICAMYAPSRITILTPKVFFFLMLLSLMSFKSSFNFFNKTHNKTQP